MIKALGYETKRAIVSIDLCKITTNQELFDIVFDQSYSVAGRDFPVRMAYDEVIYVMEDIDAATDIVLSRKLEISGTKKSAIEYKADAVLEVLADLSEGKDDCEASAVDGKEGNSDKKDGKSDNKKAETEKNETKDKDEGGLVDLLVSKKKVDEEKEKKNDKLNLSGLLNVLDGIVDTPGRLLVMTSNHPDKLDDALTRPGRIDKVIKLGYLEPEEAIEMIKYYYPEEVVTMEQQSQMYRIISGYDIGDPAPALLGMTNPAAKRFTPAELEQYCAEFEDVDSLIDHCQMLIVHFVEKNLPPGIRRQVSVGGTVRYVHYQLSDE